MAEEGTPTPAPAPEPTPNPAPATTATSGGGKKSSNTTLIVVIVVIVIALAAGGYFVRNYLAEKAGEKIAEGLIESSTGGKVDVDANGNSVTFKDDNGTTQVGDKTVWPSTMPSIVPEFTAGKLTMASKTDTVDYKGWSVTASDTTQAEFDAYRAKLVSGGWKMEYETNFGASIVEYSKDTYKLTATYDPTSSGISIAVNEDSTLTSGSN